jgi:EasF-like predicted methyltransferase
LQAFEAAAKPVHYYALDLSLSELRRTFAQLDTKAYRHVTFRALHGTYDDALAWLRDTAHDSTTTTCVMTMGSSIGNFSPDGAAKFLGEFKKVLAASDLILVGLDACQQADRVFQAYNDTPGTTEKFYRNGLAHANRILGYEAFKQHEWQVDCHYDDKLNQHSASYKALQPIHTPDFSFEEGEKVHLEDAFKYSQAGSDQLWHAAGLIPQMAYTNKAGDYGKIRPSSGTGNQADVGLFPKPFISSRLAPSILRPSQPNMPLAPFLLSMTGDNSGLLGILSPGQWFPERNC